MRTALTQSCLVFEFCGTMASAMSSPAKACPIDEAYAELELYYVDHCC